MNDLDPDSKIRGWRLIAIYAGLIVGSWALVSLVAYVAWRVLG